MDGLFATQWVRSWEAVPASMFRRGLADTELIGISMLPSRVSCPGTMRPYWTCIAVVLRRGREALIPITGAWTEWCGYSLQQSLTHSLSLCWKALSRLGWNTFPTRMAG